MEGAMRMEKRRKRNHHDEEIGAFEKHTRGIGMKLLEKMKYKGGGLGKYEQGIITPVLPKLRSKNQGLGFNDDSNEESDTKFIFQNPARRGENYITITMDEHFLLEKQDRHLDCKVIDIMPMPELQHNLRLIIGQIEVDVERIDEELSNERDTAVGLQEEIDKLRIGVARQKQELDESEQILSVLLSLEMSIC
ncbi:hypothetical protein COLO4_24094 [Corchorus olitorius]|uniref:G-patch domain-containing protein n=1 Tax=Corchorus olitorius TaxID=93759 RepID=A0A1R3ICZ2_9ROSI|nr:hypothetical protein COLO4_24094 [Corchorus olitorius]